MKIYEYYLTVFSLIFIIIILYKAHSTAEHLSKYYAHFEAVANSLTSVSESYCAINNEGDKKDFKRFGLSTYKKLYESFPDKKRGKSIEVEKLLGLLTNAKYNK